MKQINWDTLGFSILPAEKMFVSEYKGGKWDDGKIMDYGNIELQPAAGVLNYGQGIFEGMKASRIRDNRILMFQPYANAKRFNTGCRRLCMPELDEDFFVESIVTLVKENKEYIPPFGKGDLYIRPILFGSGPVLGVDPADEYTFIVFMSPVGPYFKSGFNGIRVEVREDYHRAPLYGTGAVKAIGNYATSMLPKSLVKHNGYDEVLYLDARESKYIEEVGSANIFLLKDETISTPALKGSILPGITRASILTIAKQNLGLKAEEREIPYDDLFTADEVFCTGTAAVITPILSVFFRGTEHTIGDGKPGKKTRALYEDLKGIHLGEKPDTFQWLFEVS
jgi:branched-chain amino acid aminotransferase